MYTLMNIAFSVLLLPSVVAAHTVGILAIQGGFTEFTSALSSFRGVQTIEVRTPGELQSVDSLIVAGGRVPRSLAVSTPCLVQLCSRLYARSRPGVFVLVSSC